MNSCKACGRVKLSNLILTKDQKVRHCSLKEQMKNRVQTVKKPSLRHQYPIERKENNRCKSRV
ncbi:32619_t:CDS:2 [Gigaspora margarita]|uniref:32619_t:CDS:1 n=1 Tax=Gigaspora margarita TaxID=4874 RepID=A0ABN7UVM5_GIGMA|nr:32619_t:CDS:2 [Gigaspora margarita]